MKTITLLMISALSLSAALIPGPLFSGDPNGSNLNDPSCGIDNCPNYVVSVPGFVLPDGVQAVSFDPTGTALPGKIVAFVDQWEIQDPSDLTSIDWWSTGNTVIWLDGNFYSSFSGTGQEGGTINLGPTQPQFGYFVAFVQANQCGQIAFAYDGNGNSPQAPEPATWMLGILGVGLIASARFRR